MAQNNREIERKYLLRALPSRASGIAGMEVDQGYIPGGNIHERIRRVRDEAGTRYYRTVKLGSGIERMEFEDESTQEFFDAVWPLTAGCRVHKRRYVIDAGGAKWEIDQFLDRDLVLAELEIDHVDQQIDIPDFISSVLDRDVTDEPAFTNHNLAK